MAPIYSKLLQSDVESREIGDPALFAALNVKLSEFNHSTLVSSVLLQKGWCLLLKDPSGGAFLAHHFVQHLSPQYGEMLLAMVNDDENSLPLLMSPDEVKGLLKTKEITAPKLENFEEKISGPVSPDDIKKIEHIQAQETQEESKEEEKEEETSSLQALVFCWAAASSKHIESTHLSPLPPSSELSYEQLFLLHLANTPFLL